MRLIDADHLSERVNNSTDTPLQKLYVDALLAGEPTIDAVPVVRCKDCVSFCDCGTYYLDNGCLNVHGLSDPKEDDFCPYGERRSE